MMNLDALPLWSIFAGTIVLVLASMEVGYRLGRVAHTTAPNEKAPAVSGVSAAVLGLTAFMLAFAFGSVSSRYDYRKALVRDDANAIRTTFLRSEFLPEQDRIATQALLVRYLDERIAFASGSFDPDRLAATRTASERAYRQLWKIAVANARKDMNSDVAALYIESLNQMAEINATRIAVGAQTRLPPVIWLSLLGLAVLGMTSVGYHAGIEDSQRSKVAIALAAGFALVILMIAALDRPHGFVRVTQQPLIDLRAWIGVGK
jgi:hypothetical protein